ncbi:hypothetical protein KO519_08650 [Paraglaciecola agarilytica]|uniref:hypothetical protein n=1 Tax=Paraglaciecola chathamensis TaxID=368405 RepID=UPI001C0918AC|nr:hypothetical protein [Paraglaciecola agarilytica]MBU3017757.1 hypothetical protein [Paraglaciecola agarilytica]
MTGGKLSNGAITAVFAQAFNGEAAAAKAELEVGFSKALKRLGIKQSGSLKIDSDGQISTESSTETGDLTIKFDSDGNVGFVSKNSLGLSVDNANHVFKEIVADFSPVQFSLSSGQNNNINYGVSFGINSPVVFAGLKVTGQFNLSEAFKWHPIEQRARQHDAIKNSKYCQYIKCSTLGGG